MSKQTQKTNRSISVVARLQGLLRFVLFLVAVTGVFLYTRVSTPTPVHAATSSYLNFQARLLNSAGAIVPDGTYNVEFKLYNVSSGGAALWTETWYDSNGVTAGNDNRVTVKSGYLSVYLGTHSAFPAINWDQDLWLTMNIGGTTQTATPTWDGEMTPRLKLTAVPYAMSAGQLAKFNGAQTGTLSFNTVANSPDIKLPDIAGTNNVLLQSGTTLFTQGSIPFTGANGLLTQDNANFFFDDTNNTLGIGTTRTGAIDGTGNARLIVKGSGSTSSTSSLNITNSSNASMFYVRDDGNVGVGTTAPGQKLEVDGSIQIAGTGSLLFGGTNGYPRVGRNSDDLIIQTNTGGTVLTIQDGGNIGVGDTTPAYLLTVGNNDLFGVDSSGNLNFEGSSADGFETVLSLINPTADQTYRLPNSAAGTYDICTSANNCASLGAYIQNGTSLQTNANFAIQSAGDSSVTGLIRARASQSADLLQFQNSAGTNPLSGIDSTGSLYFRDSTSGFTSTISVQAGSLSGSNKSVTLPNAGGEICTSSGNCIGNGGSGDVFKNGQTGPLIIGTNDNTSFYLETSNSNRIEIQGDGDILAGNSLRVTASGTSVLTGSIDPTASTSVTGVGTLFTSELVLGDRITVSGETRTVTAIASNTSLTVSTAFSDNANDTSVDRLPASLSVLSSSGATQLVVSDQGNVGLGTSDPTSILHTVAAGAKTANYTGNLLTNVATSSTASINKYGLEVQSTGTWNGSGANNVGLYVSSVTGGTNNYSAILMGGNVGIGTTTPGAVLHVLGASAELRTSGSATDQQLSSTFYDNNTTLKGRTIYAGANGASAKYFGLVNDSADYLHLASLNATPIVLTTDSIQRWQVTATGIFQSTGAQTIQSSTGNLTLATAAGNGSILLSPNGTGNVGINTTGPDRKLDVLDASNPQVRLTYTDGSVYTDLQTNSSGDFSISPTGSNLTLGVSQAQFSEITGTRTLTVQTRTTNVAGSNLTVVAGAAGTGGSAFSGGVLNLQGGAAAGTGNANGGNVLIQGGAGVGTGVSGSVIIRPNTTNSTTAFQVQNAAGTANIITVDTVNNSFVLGTSTVNSGSLVFRTSGDSNSITLNAPATATASYTLTLPQTTPTTGLCIATANNNATQLVFTSCFQQVSNAPITHVNGWSANGTNQTTVNVSPTSPGNLLTIAVGFQNNQTITGISGGGVASWQPITSGHSGTGNLKSVELWRGVVTTTGASTITITYSGSSGSTDIAVDEFSMNSAFGTWSIDNSSTQFNSSASTTIAYPSLTPQSTNELYIGYGLAANPPTSAGATSGFSYRTTTSGIVAYKTSTVSGVAESPTATQNSSGTSYTIAGTIIAFSNNNVVINSTNQQDANFNVRAASAGSVAGVLQAAITGTGDILNLRNGSGTNVATFSSNGNVALTPSAATSGSPTIFSLTGPAHTGLTASTEAIDINLNLARTVQFATGALTTQRALVVQAPTYGFIGASTITDAATAAITGAPTAGTNATITNSHALLIQGGTANSVTNAYGLTVNAPTGTATNKYAATFLGGNVGIGTPSPGAKLQINTGADATIGIISRANSATQSANLLEIQASNGATVAAFNKDGYLGINGAVFGNVGLIVRPVQNTDQAIRIVAHATQSGDLFQIKASNGTTDLARFGATGALTISTAAGTSGTPAASLTVTAAAHTTLANAEAIDVNLNLARTVQFGQNTALATQRAFVIQAPTYASSVATKTITDTATLAITGAPVEGANTAITNSHALLIQGGAATGATNAYGLTVNAPTSGTNNYAAAFLGGNVGVGNATPTVALDVGPITLAASEIVQTRIGDFLLQSQQGGSNGLAALTSRGSNGNLTVDGASGAGFYTSPFTTNNNFLVSGGGKVAVGTTNVPTAKFEITNTGSAPHTIPGFQLQSTFSPTAGGTQNNARIITTNSATSSANTTRGLEITVVDATSLANTNIGLYVDATTANSSDTQYAAIFQGGNVGVGTATPGLTLDVAGSSRVLAASGTNGNGSFIWDGTTNLLNYQGVDIASTTYAFFGTNRTYTGSAWTSTGFYGARAGATLQVENDALAFYQFAASSNTPIQALRIAAGGNVGIATSAFGTSATGVFALGQATAPSTSPSDNVQLYVTDAGAGDARLRVRMEGGGIVTFPNETGTICTTGSVCSGYAAAAANGYVQLAPASVQTDTTTNSSIFINKTGASGNILQLQKSGVDKLVVDNSGSVGIGETNPTSMLHTVATGAKTATYTGNLLTNTATSSTASINKYGLEVRSTGTWNGTSANNVGLYVSSVTGGTNNYDAIFNGGGNVGIGMASPGTKLTVQVANGVNAIDATDGSSHLVLRPASSGVPNVIGVTSANDMAFITNNTSRIYVQDSSGNVGIATGNNASLSTLGIAGNVAIGSTYATNNAGPSNGLLVEGNIAIGAPTSTADLSFGGETARTIKMEVRTGNSAGNNLTVAAGAGGAGASAVAGGQLILQGGAAGGSGTGANGGAVTISGGAGVGTGTQGLVNLSTTAFSSAGVQTFGSSASITAGNIDLYSTLPVTASATGVVVTVPDPAQSVIGRLVYISARSGSNDFTLRFNSARTPIDIAMKANSTATLIWNGTDWTAAGASSSTDLQSAYNNTLTSAGGAELILNAAGGAADGLTIRNNTTTPITGGIFEVQSSIGTNLFSVNNLGTELAANGGAETSSTFATNWTAAPVSATIARTTTSGEYVTGQAGVRVTTTTTANSGVRNNLSGNPVNTIGARYQVSFTAKSNTNGTPIDVLYSRDGGTSTESCTSYSSQTLSNTVWTKITCTITISSATAVTDPDLIIRKTDTTSPVIYIDNLSFMRNDSTTQPSNVQIGGGINGGPVTLFTLDRSTAPPVPNGDSTYYGSMYYDITTGRIQCYESDGWGACGSAPDNIITLTPEYTGAVLNGNGIGTMTADFCGNGGGLSVNTSFCASGEARSYYRWTSPQTTDQTYSIYVNYKLPSTFKEFLDDNTIKLTAYKDHATNAGATLDVYRKNVGAGTITQCGSNTTITTGTSTWNTTSLGGSGEQSSCVFAAGDYVIFKITVTAKNAANVYIENLDFTFTNK